VTEVNGFLIDLYADRRHGGIVLWLLADTGERLLLRQRFPVTVYVAGTPKRLRALWAHLSQHPSKPILSRTERRELFSPEPLTVMVVQVEQAIQQPRLVREVAERFPDLEYYDADVPLLARYAAVYDVFPLTRCRVVLDAAGWVQSVLPLETRWALDPAQAPLRILAIEPDIDPFHAHPQSLHLVYGKQDCPLELAA
jgi:hypothetical protein